MEKNIYEDFGTIITSKRYIDRSIENSIISRITGNNFGSYSLVGLHRVGKSTLLNYISKQLEDIVIYISLSSFEKVEQFFNKIVKEIIKQLKKFNIYTDEIMEIHEEYKNCDFKIDGTELFLEFLEIVSDEINKKLIIIIDEFDAAIKLFEKKVHYFQVIREISIQSSNYKTVFIFSSRRLVEEIEIKMDGISNLRQVLKVGFLTLYDENEQNKYFEILSNYFFISEDIKNAYKKYTGFYPFLMDILSVYLVDKYSNKNLTVKNIDEIFQNNINEFYSHYEKLKNLLIEENLFDDLIDLAFNIPFESKTLNIQKLKNYGLIDEKHNIFCKSFEKYLLEQKGLSEYYKVWYETENKLKYLLKENFKKNYGKNWENKLKDKYKNNNKIFKIIKSAEYYKSQEIKINNPNYYLTYIDSISTSGLLKFILEEWNIFMNIFGKTKEYWYENFDLIKDVRNLKQHNREVDKLMLKETVLQCEKIIKLIDEHFKRL